MPVSNRKTFPWILNFMLAVPGCGLAQEITGHLANTNCEYCHLTSGEVTIQSAGRLVASQESLCKGCHQGAIEVSHPTGMQPTINVPELFPLDWKGDVTCSTCHLVHNGNPGLMRTEARGREFCVSCHNEEFFQQMADGGQSVIDTTHQNDGNLGVASNIDSYSIRCLDCHLDTQVTTPINLDNGIIRHLSGVANHPVGVQYEIALSYGGYRSPNSLHADIKLPEGKVSCVSCHYAYNKIHGAIVQIEEGPTLCYQCHDI